MIYYQNTVSFEIKSMMRLKRDKGTNVLHVVVPVKYEHVVFCRLSEFQTKLYNLFLTSPEIKCLLRGVGSQPLKGLSEFPFN